MPGNWPVKQFLETLSRQKGVRKKNTIAQTHHSFSTIFQTYTQTIHPFPSGFISTLYPVDLRFQREAMALKCQPHWTYESWYRPLWNAICNFVVPKFGGIRLSAIENFLYPLTSQIWCPGKSPTGNEFICTKSTIRSTLVNSWDRGTLPGAWSLWFSPFSSFLFPSSFPFFLFDFFSSHPFLPHFLSLSQIPWPSLPGFFSSFLLSLVGASFCAFQSQTLHDSPEFPSLLHLLLSWTTTSSLQRIFFKFSANLPVDKKHVCLLQGPRCRMRGGGRNGPTRNSSGAVAADLWCSELKRGADGVKKHPCLSNYWPKPKHDKPHRFCKHPQQQPSSPDGPLRSAMPPCTPSRPACSPKIAQTTPTWRETSPPSARCSPKHPSTPPLPAAFQPAPKEPRQPGDWPVKQSWSETHAKKGARKKKKLGFLGRTPSH